MSNKTKNFLKLSLFVLFFFLSSFASAQENVAALAKKITPSIVSVTTYDEHNKAVSQGNGFFVNARGDVISNVPIPQNARRAEIKTSEGTVYPVKGVGAIDKKNYLILLAVNLPPQKAAPLSLSPSVPVAGEKIAVVFQKGVSEGNVSAIQDIPGVGKIVPITASLSPGLGGSPVVNMRGEVIGIATLQAIQGQNRAVVIPRGQIALVAVKPPVTVSPGEDPFVSGMKFFQATRFDQALPYFEQAVKKDPKKSEAYFYSGLCYANLGRKNEAIEAYKKAIGLKPDYADAHNNLGAAYANLGRFADAADEYKQTIRLMPDHALAHFNLGMAYVKLGRNNEAIESFKQVIRLKPDNPYAHNYLGLTYARIGRNNEAIESFQQAVRLKPDYCEAYNNLGASYGKLDRPKEAVEAFKRAISLKPDYAGAHLNLGIAYVKLGNKDSARGEYKILKTLNPQQADEFLKEINQSK
jgi:Flp pilus assembly protein TadD